ncbi:hypothetical protein [Streptomyces virginiae]|uniref:hypothetical protein n=1 Tax=Streptomyces virginiae TaxID=1961 RepID=UPI0036FEAAB2
MAEYMLDWTALLHDEPLYEADVDLSGPIADYDAHLSVIRDAAVQLPEELTGLLAELARRLDGLAARRPGGSTAWRLDGLAAKESLITLKALAGLR